MLLPLKCGAGSGGISAMVKTAHLQQLCYFLPFLNVAARCPASLDGCVPLFQPQSRARTAVVGLPAQCRPQVWRKHFDPIQPRRGKDLPLP